MCSVVDKPSFFTITLFELNTLLTNNMLTLVNNNDNKFTCNNSMTITYFQDTNNVLLCSSS